MKPIEEMSWDELRPFIEGHDVDGATFRRAWVRELELELACLKDILAQGSFTRIQASALQNGIGELRDSLLNARWEKDGHL